MSDAARIDAQEAKLKVDSGDALLVCAYGSDEKFQANHLEGAISLSEFKHKVSGLDRNTGLIFYCG